MRENVLRSLPAFVGFNMGSGVGGVSIISPWQSIKAVYSLKRDEIITRLIISSSVANYLIVRIHLILHALRGSPNQFTWSWLAIQYHVPEAEWPSR